MRPRLIYFLTLAAISVSFALDDDDQSKEAIPTSDLLMKVGPGETSALEFDMMLRQATKRTRYSRRKFNNLLDRTRISDGDLRLSGRQYVRLYGKARRTLRSKRRADSDLSKRWTNNEVIYTFEPGVYTEKHKTDIRTAMDLYSELTCLTFREKREGDENYIVFQDNGSGCNSALGMAGGAQALNLDADGCRWMGLYLHELGHALGLIHEHQRPDRDDHLRVVWRRIGNRDFQTFNKYARDAVNYYGTEYDPSSIMHYEAATFNKNEEPTIIMREPWKLKLLHRIYFKTISWTDTKILNAMYQCDAKCNVDCPAEAYVDKNCKCVFPEDIYNHVCVNNNDDKYCEKLLINEGCTSENRNAAENIIYDCRKTCGTCPMYGRDDIVKPKFELADDAWANLYMDDDKCDEWAEKQYCESFRPHWLKRNCRKSCGEFWCRWHKIPMNQCEKAYAKHFPYGKCQNTYKINSNFLCDLKANCTTDFWKVRCADTCQTCGYQYPGDCEDSDPSCQQRAMNGDCDSPDYNVAIGTLTHCQKSCNSCGFNSGKCANTLDVPDPYTECAKAAILGKCKTDYKKYKDKCRRACNSCDYGETGDCENISPEFRSTCAWFRILGDCREKQNIAEAKHFCGKDCNFCEYQKNPKCEDYDELCPHMDWSNCFSASRFWSMTKCKKTCKYCDKLDPSKCMNYDIDEICEDYKKNHDICNPGRDSWKHQKKRYCRRTCGECEGNPEVLPPRECKDVVEECPYYKRSKQCEKFSYMKYLCPVSCGNCTSEA